MNGIDSRPLTFEEVIGQERAKRLFLNTLKTGCISRAYVFSGAYSTSKTTLAYIFARAILCENRHPESFSPCNKCVSCRNFLRDAHPGYIEVDAANSGTKDNVADILRNLSYDNGEDKRVIFLDEAHQISTAGKDALLKEFERPLSQDGTVFMLSTTELAKMPEALLSRCVRVPLSRPTNEDVLKKLNIMCKKTGVPVADTHALKSLAIWAQGHYRDAENALEPLVLMGGITSENVAAYTAYDVEAASELLVVLETDLSRALTLGESISSKYGLDSAHMGLIRTLLDAIRYGLSGLSYDVPECVKKVYSVYNSRMGAILQYLVSRAKMVDPWIFQAELVNIHHKFLRGDLDVSSVKASVGVIPGAASQAPSRKPGVMSLSEQRALKAGARKNGENNPIVEETVSQVWGPETVDNSVSLKRS